MPDRLQRPTSSWHGCSYVNWTLDSHYTTNAYETALCNMSSRSDVALNGMLLSIRKTCMWYVYIRIFKHKIFHSVERKLPFIIISVIYFSWEEFSFQTSFASLSVVFVRCVGSVAVSILFPVLIFSFTCFGFLVSFSLKKLFFTKRKKKKKKRNSWRRQL